MMSSTFDRSFECAPHATRSVALALALSLNLVLVLLALRPHTPPMIHAPPPQALLAALLQPPNPPVEPPATPTLRVVKHAAPSIRVAPVHPAPVAVPALDSLAPVVPIASPTALPALATDGVATVANSDATIAYETATAPDYPIQALRAGIQGTVLLKVLVGASGQPVEVMVARSSGSRVLDDAARRHVLATWRFHPATRDGHAIEAWALVPVQFKLDRG